MLKGKAAIVTGSSKGIGRQIALEFARNGADVIINGNNEAQLNSLKGEIEASGSGVVIVRGDISLPETSSRLAEASISTLGKIDVMHNNAVVNSRIQYRELAAEGRKRRTAFH